MKKSRRITLEICFVLLFAPVVSVYAQVPGDNVNVSNLARAQSETGIAKNPTNPANLVSVSNNLRDLSKLGVWFSIDGGANWTANFIDENEDGFGAADNRFDPNVIFDSDGTVHVVYSTTGSGNRLLLASSDGVIRSFNPENGAQVASFPLSGGAASNPVVAGRTLYDVTAKGKLVAYR